MQENTILAAIAKELKQFQSFVGFKGRNFSLHGGEASMTMDLLPQPGSGLVQTPGKRFGLCVMGLTHGNEVVGVAVINRVLEYLCKSDRSLPFPISFVLGNTTAANENKRYLVSDLNRSFGRSQVENAEHQRAKELEPILKQSSFLLDMHQTREKSERPFFIFPYTPAALRFAHLTSPDLPIVTHWQGSFSKDGRCSDEYINTQAGIGITVELGQNGFSHYCMTAGFFAVLAAIEAARRMLTSDKDSTTEAASEIYTWAQVFEYPMDKEVVVEPGFYNFATVAAGQKIAQLGDTAVLSPVDGRILFPYYARSTDTRRPSEFCRIMRRISPNELPE